MHADLEDAQLLRRELAQLRQELVSVNAKLHEAEALRRRLEIELKTSSNEASRLLRRLAEAHAETTELADLRARVAQPHRELTEERTKVQGLQTELHATRAAAVAETEQSRLALAAEQETRRQEQEAHRAEQEALRAEQEAHRADHERGRAALRQAEQHAEQLARLLHTARHDAQESAARIDHELRLRVAAEKTAAQVHSTLAFQLGSALIQAFKSPAKFLSLPKRLWQLRGEAARRRGRKQLKAARRE